jgi:L-alanine-DL-glutamate epimerase-like enolase superfamily enzyme
MGLRITDVRCATVVGNYYWTYVRVYAGDDYGTGEGFFAPALEGIVEELGRLLIGEDALDLRRVYDKVLWASVPSGPYGSNYHALSAIEIALLDLVGKHLNVPVYTLLGGKYRERVRIYADTHAGASLEAMGPTLLPITPRWMKELGVQEKEGEKGPLHGRASKETFSKEFTPEAYGKRAKEMKGEGFTAVKFDLDVPTPHTEEYNRASGSLTNREVEYLAGLAAAVREGMGDEGDILFDLHWRFNVESAIRLARALEPYHVMWLEDPVPPSNPALLNLIADATATPIATGENLYSRYGFAPLLDSRIRIVTPDALKTGGLRETQAIAEMAAMREMVTSPHNIGSPIGTLAQAHVSAAIPNFGVLEFHGHDVPLWYRLTRRKIIEKGFIPLTDEAGLGVELEERVAEKYAPDGRFEL